MIKKHAHKHKSRKPKVSITPKTVAVLLILLVGLFSWFFLSANHRLPLTIEGVLGVNKKTKDNIAKTDHKRLNSHWRPRLDKFSNQESSLRIQAKSALALNYDSGQVFYSLNPKRRLPIASLTKIMTALVVLDHVHNPTKQIFEVPLEITNLPLEGSMMGLSPGEHYTGLDLLYGLMLSSGNDTALTLAKGVGGTETNFVYLMNRRARSLGLVDTNFMNSSGLDNKQAYSTAYDLAILTHYTLDKYPILAKIVSTKHYTIPYNQGHKYLNLKNFNDLLFVSDEVTGVKPGNTQAAGSSLVATAKKGTQKIMAIVLGTESRNQPSLDLINFAFESF